MAGGKETPRQKMIGMMYLVLTALLALNVSKTILDAFVAIEDNTQKSNIMNHDRGQGFYMDLTSELAATKDDAENAAKREKIKFYIKQMEKVDVETAKMIKQIDDIKLHILEKSGEEIDFAPTNKNNEEKIIWSKYDPKNYPVLPIRMNLMAVQAKDQYDVPMFEIIGEDIRNPTGMGKKLWEDFNNYRSKLVETLGTYNLGGNFSIKPTKINMYKDNKDLTTKVTKMVRDSKANLQEDENVLIQIYMSLTKLEKENVNGVKDVHWIGKTFDHSPLVAALASLSSMQQDILSARATALSHIKGKISTGEFSFNKVMALAYGPAIANGGDEVELKVMMAAFDSDNQPKVTSSTGEITVDGGQGTVKLKTSANGEMTITGTVAIKKKSGDTKTEKWEHTIKIMKPEGTVTLPDMNVLYRGYPNIVTGVASGYDQTILAGASNVSLAKSGSHWIGSPGAGAEAVISVSGKNTVTGKTQPLGKFNFRVRPLPKPSIFVGSTGAGGKISSNPGGLNAGYPPEIPLNANFTVLDWEVQVSGIMGKATGNGSSLAGVNKILGQAKAGSSVMIEAGVRGPDGRVNRIYEVFKLN